MLVKRLCAIFVSLYSSFIATGQEGELQQYQNGFYIKQFSETDGLVYNGGNNLYEDSRGFLWICTFNGLSRFDGKLFENYSIKEGLPGSEITQVSEDSAGYIYVATTVGIARYTGYNKSSDTWFHIYPQTTHLHGNILGMQAIDSNTLIFQKSNGAVYLLKKDKLTEIAPPTGSSGFIYRNGCRYFYALAPDTLRVFNSRFENVKNVYWKSGEFRTRSIDSYGGLHIYSGNKKWRIRDDKIVYESQVPDSIIKFASTDTLNAMFYDRSEIIYCYDGKSSQPVLDMKKLSLSANALIQSKDGSIWVLSSSGGLFRITRLPYTSEETKDPICYHFERGKRIIYADNRFNGSPAFIRARDSLRRITESILIDSKGNAWFCTTQGLYKQPPHGDGQLHIFPGDRSAWEAADRIRYGIETRNGDLWFYGSPGAILYKNNVFKHYNVRSGITLHGGLVLSVIADKDENVLLTDDSYKLYYVAGDTVLPAVNAAGSGGFFANVLTVDNRGYAWLEFNKKLYRLEKQANGKFAVTDSIIPSNISSAETKAFEFDLQGNCWINLTGGDLQVFFINSNGHYNSYNSVVYTKDDGLSSLGERYYRFAPDDNGNMNAFALKKGSTRLLTFSLQNAVKRKQLETLSVNIGSVLINHKKADWLFYGNNTGHDSQTPLLTLLYNENNITFNYSSSSLSNPSNILFKTMLKGFDKEWQETHSASASYTNLPAGNYTFLIQAANANGIWGSVRTYPFAVLPPWYRTWWATSLWIIVSICIMFLIFFIRLNSLRTSMRMSHLEESSRFKSSLIGLIGHDMVTPLMYIAKVSLQLRNYNEKLSKQTTLESLGEINTTATRLHFFGTSIIHWIKVQNADFNPVVEKFHVNEIIKELVDFHHPLAAEKGNEIDYELHDDLYGYQDPTLVRIILHNLLLNASKFTSKGMINVAADIENNVLTIHVKDNGRGMDHNTVDLLNRLQPIHSTPGTSKEKGWGMGYKVIIDMLKFTGGTLFVKSRLNEGTEVIIKLPCGEDRPFTRGNSRLVNDAAAFRN